MRDMKASAPSVEIVEVGPRDGFQSVGPLIPTSTKTAIIEQLYRAGTRRIETTSFVSPSALPQLADALRSSRPPRCSPVSMRKVLVPTAATPRGRSPRERRI